VTEGQPAEPRAERVLIVEDDAEIREAVQALLEEDGYHVGVARNGLEALTWLEQNGQPSIILLDLMMPVMDGRTFLTRLAGLPPWRSVPVMVMSAQPRQPVPGAVAVLEKPFDADFFLAEVRRHKRWPASPERLWPPGEDVATPE
jgi:CheY-like chemotaxis protein